MHLSMGFCGSQSGVLTDDYENEAISELSLIHVVRIFRPVECHLFDESCDSLLTWDIASI